MRAALVAGGADPNLLVDEEGRSLLHKAESPEQITLLLQNPLTDVNATNRVRQASLLRIDDALCPSRAPPVCSLLSDLLHAKLTPFSYRRPAERRSRHMPSRASCGRHYSPAEPTRTSR